MSQEASPSIEEPMPTRSITTSSTSATSEHQPTVTTTERNSEPNHRLNTTTTATVISSFTTMPAVEGPTNQQKQQQDVFERRLAALDDLRTEQLHKEESKRAQLEIAVDNLKAALNKQASEWQCKVEAAVAAAYLTLQNELDAQIKATAAATDNTTKLEAEWQQRLTAQQEATLADVNKSEAEIHSVHEEKKATVQRLLGETANAKLKLEEQRHIAAAAETHRQQADERCTKLEKQLDHYKSELETFQQTVVEKARSDTDQKEQLKVAIQTIAMLESQIQQQTQTIQQLEEHQQLAEKQAAAAEERATEAHKKQVAAEITTKTLELAISDCKLRESAARKQLKHSTFQLQHTQATVRDIERDIERLIPLIQKPNDLKAAVIKLYQTHVHSTNSTTDTVVPTESNYSSDPSQKATPTPTTTHADTNNKQVENLERQLTSCRRVLQQERSRAALEKQRFIQDNTKLVEEVKLLRQEQKNIAGKTTTRLG